MELIHGLDSLPRNLRFVLTIGVFDGVHRGHERVLRALVRNARRLNAKAVALTFDPHPAQLLRGAAPPLLCDTAERLARLNRLGVDIAVIQSFDETFAGQSAEEFIARVCRGRQLVGLVMAAGSSFGRGRAGGVDSARKLGELHGFEVIEVARLATDGSTVSSTKLRGLLAGGRLAGVKRLLGRPYAVVGRVVRGDRRGRTLGYPTANLAFDREVALPPDGIYAVRVTWGGDDVLTPRGRRNGVASLGVRPTFGGGDRTLEVYLFDFDQDIYGQDLRVEFARRLRGEKKFGSAEALVRQIDRDAERARQLLTGPTSG